MTRSFRRADSGTDAYKEEPRDHCIRCGDCCLKSSPSLQLQDLPKIQNGFIPKGLLYTIRKGELVRDNLNDTLGVTNFELIKVKERGKRGCLLYDEKEKACRIYEHRPVQCEALKCWDPSDFIHVYRQSKLTRREIIEDPMLLELIEHHENRCSYLSLEKYLKRIEAEGEEPIRRILDMLRLDFHSRPFLSQRLGLNPEEMDLLLGRPLADTIPMFGLQVVREPEGAFLLTTIKSNGHSTRRDTGHGDGWFPVFP